ncbi:nuclear transport factor 2 family protein [Novosphingobium decolorationis]|uniref:Nuclear transport factor 2 family protein n=1 Tax=Novosphingobium decolorationis TaxID=2698673 RepID=A0ABX8E3R9_9SPHN|nr:nuclear transport factor 2 family protein [Novosphingobium decolorationis]MED5545111.1 nuclear transport factor 2 family protein [Pseudomonadota bacterium]QVM83588.1 nuclear transport factor 2 family protein [Novosphingobium decolorationis]
MAEAETLQQRNARIVLDMWQGVIREGSREAVLRYIHPDYVQHAVNLPSGREQLLHLTDLIRNPPEGFVPPATKHLVRTVAQDDTVVVIWHQDQPDPARPGQTYPGHAFDMYRLEDGLIVEHWDDTRKWARSWAEEQSGERS